MARKHATVASGKRYVRFDGNIESVNVRAPCDLYAGETVAIGTLVANAVEDCKQGQNTALVYNCVVKVKFNGLTTEPKPFEAIYFHNEEEKFCAGYPSANHDKWLYAGCYYSGHDDEPITGENFEGFLLYRGPAQPTATYNLTSEKTVQELSKIHEATVAEEEKAEKAGKKGTAK